LKRILLLVILFFAFISCKNEKNDWEIEIPGVTSSSSPMCTDLNNDGIKDIVMGAGGEEWEKTPTGIIAINGLNGNVLWFAQSRNQIVGSAVFLDINDDNIDDVIIGGRSAELQVLDGRTGHIIWEFYSKKGRMMAHDDGWFNFFNPQIIKDQDKDGIKDIIICNGGDALLAAGSTDRPAGKLLLISGKSGKILAQDTMPDGQETYFSPICIDCDTNENPTIIYGSGGETRPGHLYICKLADLKNKNLKHSIAVDSTKNKGFISPPILANFNKDGVLDIIYSNAEGGTKLIDGTNYKQIWQVKVDNAEIYSQPAVGYFTGNDDVLDVFINNAIGTFPTYSSTINTLINGKSGEIIKKFMSKSFSYSSPIVADLNNDGSDEVILNENKSSKIKNKEIPFYQLTTFDFKNNKIEKMGKQKNGACFASTPWLGDLDADGKLDLIYTGSPAIVSEFPGNTTYQKPDKKLIVNLQKFNNINAKSVKWGNYMGNDAKSIYIK
jgi:hypothetical protein